MEFTYYYSLSLVVLEASLVFVIVIILIATTSVLVLITSSMRSFSSRILVLVSPWSLNVFLVLLLLVTSLFIVLRCDS